MAMTLQEQISYFEKHTTGVNIAEVVVGWQFQDDDGDWHFGSEHHNHKRNSIKGGYKVRDVYALAISPSTKELLLCGKVRDALHLANYLINPTHTIEDESAYIAARDSVLKALEQFNETTPT